MVQWEVLDAEGDEETRQAKDLGCLTSLYEVVKLTYFHPSEEVTGLPVVSASAAYGQVAVTLEQTLFALGESCSSLLLQLSLEDPVSLVLWVPQGDFLVLGDVVGKIHYLHVASRRLLISRQLPVKKTTGKAFVGGRCNQSLDGTLTVFLITSCGQIFSLKNIDNDALSEGLRLENEDALKTVAGQISLSIHTLGPDNAEVSSVGYYDSGPGLWCSGKDGLTLWTPDSLQDPHQPLPWTLTHHPACSRTIPLWNARYLVVLGEDGAVAVLCGATGLTQWEAGDKWQPIKDMRLLQEEEDRAQFLFLLNDPDSEGDLLRVVSFPGFSVVYELAVSDGTSLISLGEGAESIMFLEPEISPIMSVTKNIKLKSIVDGLPDARLAKLLVKRKFKEAEEFCNLFQLDVEEVHKARAQHLCELLNPWHSTSNMASLTMHDMEAGSSLMEELLSTLEKINDANFVTTMCVEAPMTNLSTTKRILTFAKERLAQATQSGEGDKMSELMQRVCETLYCLRTFEIVFPSSDIQHWLTFSHTDMLEECLEHLSQSNLEVTSTLWHRHQYEFSQHVNEDCVAQVLTAIPHNIPSKTLCHWLPNNILADLVKFCRSSLDLIALWADERVRKLEMLERAQWPTCGLNLASTIITVLENVTSDFLADGSAESSMVGQVAFSPSIALQRLQQTARALQDLKLLASSFRIKIELSEYMQDDKTAVVAALLDCLLCGEDVAPLIQGFLRNFFVRHQLDHDVTLARYVLDTLAASDHDWWAWQEAPWEDKLYAIIDVMSDAELRGECLLECIRVAPVPWSEGTQAACELGLSLNASVTSQLENQKSMVGLKLVLRRYALHMMNVDDPRNAKMILKKIVSHNEASVMADALCVINTYRHLREADAYFYRALHLLSTRNITGLKEFLLEMDDNLQKKICQQLITYMTQALLLPCKEKGKGLHLAVTEGLISLEVMLKKWAPPASPAGGTDLFATAYNLHSLQTHYSLYPTLREMEDKAARKTLLQDHVTGWYKENVYDFDIKNQLKPEGNEDEIWKRKSLINVPVPPTAATTPSPSKKGGNVWMGMSRLHWLASLLGVPRADLLSHLALLASKSSRLEEAIQLCQELLAEPSMDECSGAVYEVVRLAVDQLSHVFSHQYAAEVSCLSSTALQEKESAIKSHANLISIVHELVSTAMLSVHPDLLPPLLDLDSWCWVGQTLYSQCHVEDVYTHSRNTESSNPYTTWKFSPLFFDASIPIENHLVLSLITQALEGCLKSRNTIESTHFIPYLESSKTTAGLEEGSGLTGSLQDLMSHLHERGQDLLALLLPLKVLQRQPQFTPTGWSPTWKQVFTILLKVLSVASPDVTLAVSLLLLLPKRDALRVTNELIKRFGFDYVKLMSIAALGRDYCSLFQVTEVKEQFEVLLMRAQWGKRVTDMNVSFKEAFRGDKVALRAVVSQLVSHPDCNFTLLYEYCEDFGLDVTDSLLCYLQTTLQSWSPAVPTKEPAPGEVVLVEPPHAVLSKCQAIIAEMKSKSLLYKMLLSELDQLSSYNYEMIQLVLQQLIALEDIGKEMELHQRGLDVISFLKVYVRHAPPGNTEVDEWITSHPQSLGPPDIAKHRLPFHEFYNQSQTVMKIIEAELNISTVDIWVQASHILKLNADHMCLQAVRNTVSKTLELEGSAARPRSTSLPESAASTPPSQWRLCSSHSTVLAQVNSIICKMQDYELSAACANWVVNRLPPGADRVMAAEKSCLLVQLWKEKTSDPNAANALAKMEMRYQQLASEHSLHKHGLAEPQYLALTRTPVDLVSALYQHPALNSLSSLCTHNMPDIHACVSEICSIAELKQGAIQLDLLEKWLPPPEAGTGGAMLDETITNFKVTLDPTDNGEAEDASSNTSLSRVIYLLRGCPQEQAVSYLLNRALSEDASVSASHRLRALRCLLAIGDEAVIQKQYQQGVDSLRSLLKSVMYVSRLEALGHTSSVQQFSSMDKSALVEGLWRSQRHNPKALCLITDICHDYNVTAASLWGALLMQLTRFVKSGQVEMSMMERVLLQLKTVPHLRVVPALTTAWVTLITHPFIKAVSPVSEASLASCVHSVDLLLRHCPVVVPIAPLLQYCSALNLPVLALVIAAADQEESHDLQSMAAAADTNTLKTSYLKLKLQFAFPRHVEELLESLE